MACEYIYGDNPPKSYDELIKNLSESDINTALSILFSLTEDKQANTLKKIDDLKEQHKLKIVPYSVQSSYSSILGDPDVDTPSGYFSTQTFIDSGHYLINGDAPVFRIDTDKYLKLEYEKFIKEENMSEDEAKARCELIKQHDERVGKDAYDLHKILVLSHKDHDDRHFSELAVNTSFAPIYDQLGKVVRSIEKGIRRKHAGGALRQNINLEAEIRNISEKIIGHIDYLIVNEDGTIDIFNIKASTQNESEWNNVKKEKFRHQLALIKRILEFNGIDARRIRVNIIPVKMKYDETFENIVELITEDEPISYDSRGYNYIFQLYDNIAAQFIDSKAHVEPIDDRVFEKVNLQLNKIFAGRDIDIKYTGIKESAKSWIASNWKYIASHAKDKKGWDVRFPDSKETIYIEDTRVGVLNEELINLVIDREEELFKNTSREKGSYRLVQDIIHSYNHEYDSLLGANQNNAVLDRQLRKYFDKDSNGKYKWELVENQELLNDANIMLFKHKVTNLLDVFVISPYDISTKAFFKKRNNLLGNYIPDLNVHNFTMEANYGNIEAIRTLTLLNEILPSLDFQAKLGEMRIVNLSPNRRKKGCEFDIASLLPNFDTVVKVTNLNNDKLDMKNNFKNSNILVIDPAELFILTWREVIDANPTHNLTEIKGLSDEIILKIQRDGSIVDGLETVTSIESKIHKLEIILDRLKNFAESRGISLSPKDLIIGSKEGNPERSATCKVYSAALNALNKYYGDLHIDNEEFSQMEEYLARPQHISNINVRTVAYMFLKSINKIADLMMDRYAPIKQIIQEFYKDCGYGNLLNSIIGNQAAQFNNLYEIVDGQKTMRFKNPYSVTNDLKDYERKFLKSILWEFYKIRCEMWGKTLGFSGINDPKLIQKLENNDSELRTYLNVPLERASNATRRSKMFNGIQEFGKRWWKRIVNPKEAFKEFTEGVLSEEDARRKEDDIQNLSAYNPFNTSESSENIRLNMLNDKGVDYFETNVENLIIDFLEKHLQSVEYNKMLTRTKGILLDLHLRGEMGDDPKAIEHTVKTIEDFLSVSVFNKSIMEETSLKFEVFMGPIRQAVSKCYIACNPTGAVRDIMQGMLENTIRCLNKFHTDISPKDIMHGYKEVITEGPTSPNKIMKFNLLNLKYRFSNLDVARISEGQKTGRSGILNFDNLAYSTLRGPDYLNRMVLFSARMHHDGVEDAYFIKDGQLVYDYKKDKRFEAYVKNDKSDLKKYSQQRSLYLSLLRQFNQDNGTNLVEGDPLPDAYTLTQIENFKTFADNIYGSYNKSTRAKYEHTALGINFTAFSTWMNGIVNVYTKKRLISKGESKWEIETNAKGENLYFDAYNNIVTLEEGGDPNTPVMRDVPVMVQGVFATLRDSAVELFLHKDFKKNIWGSEIHRRNFRRLWHDMLVWFIIGMMFKLALDPAYKDHKKNADGKDFITNALIELTYKSASSCYDGFKGPFAVLTYFGESTNPATYNLSKKVLTDGYNLISGNKSFGDILINSQALPRSFKDSYKMYIRDTKTQDTKKQESDK